MANFDIDKFINETQADSDLWLKVQEMMRHVVDNSIDELRDISGKYTEPNDVGADVVKEIINERGFDYIVSMMNTISGFEFNTMLFFVDLISQLKGHRDGLELILKLLGFDSLVVEWWQQAPKGTPHTYNIVVLMDNSFVPDVAETLEKVKEFSRHYVHPIIDVIDFRFNLESFAERNLNLAGFLKYRYDIKIIQRAI